MTFISREISSNSLNEIRLFPQRTKQEKESFDSAPKLGILPNPHMWCKSWAYLVRAGDLTVNDQRQCGAKQRDVDQSKWREQIQSLSVVVFLHDQIWVVRSSRLAEREA